MDCVLGLGFGVASSCLTFLELGGVSGESLGRDIQGTRH